jgi:hypothetical protein
MQTKGRKSSLKKYIPLLALYKPFHAFSDMSSQLTSRKTKDTGEVDEDGNPIKLEDVEKEGDGEIGDEAVSTPRVQDVDEDLKAEVEVNAEQEEAAFNGDGVEAVPVTTGDTKPNLAEVEPSGAGQMGGAQPNGADGADGVDGDSTDAKPKRGRPKGSGGKAKTQA